jgi:hypothetical protein
VHNQVGLSVIFSRAPAGPNLSVPVQPMAQANSGMLILSVPAGPDDNRTHGGMLIPAWLNPPSRFPPQNWPAHLMWLADPVRSNPPPSRCKSVRLLPHIYPRRQAGPTGLSPPLFQRKKEATRFDGDRSCVPAMVSPRAAIVFLVAASSLAVALSSTYTRPSIDQQLIIFSVDDERAGHMAEQMAARGRRTGTRSGARRGRRIGVS